jgi:hypothetical protein
MRWSAYKLLLGWHWRDHRASFFSLGLGSLAGGFFLTLFLAIAIGLPKNVLSEIEEWFPGKRVIIKAKPADLAMLRVDAGLDETHLAQVRGLPDIASVAPIEPLRIASSLSGSLFDFTLQSDVIVWGIPEEYLVENARADEQSLARIQNMFRDVDWQAGESLPFVVPGFYLDMYNSGLAASSGLPQISPHAALGREVELLMGTTTVGLNLSGKTKDLDGEVVGLIRDAQLLGVLLPLKTVQSINSWAANGHYTPRYVSFIAELENLDAYADLENVAKKQNWVLEGNRDLLASARLMTYGGAAVLAVFGLAAVVLVALQLSSLTVFLNLQFFPELLIFRCLGGKMGQLLRLFLLEVGSIAGASALLGGGVALALLTVAESVILDQLPALTFLPAQVLWLPLYLPVVISGAMLLLAVGILYRPLRRTQKKSPAELLAGEK